MIHVLHEGATLCGKPWTEHQKQYAKDRWVRRDDAIQSTCRRCLKAAGKAGECRDFQRKEVDMVRRARSLVEEMDADSRGWFRSMAILMTETLPLIAELADEVERLREVQHARSIRVEG